MTAYRLVAEPRADLDVAATCDWYENEEAGLGQDFLDELRATYDRIAMVRLRTRISAPASAEGCCGASRTPYTLPSKATWWSCSQRRRRASERK